MSRFIESIRIENGEAPLLAWHQKRVNACMQTFHPGAIPPDLKKVALQYRDVKGLHKLRIVYDDKIRKITCHAYTPRRIKRFHIRKADELNYSWKFEDRSQIEAFSKTVSDSEDVILTRNGEIMDSSYANLVFERDNRLYTPIQPLLKGCRRSMLVAAGIITPVRIRADELHLYDGMYLINGMLKLESSSYYSPIPLA
jgi:4-amino-4-deoxychorismate lyase